MSVTNSCDSPAVRYLAFQIFILRLAKPAVAIVFQIYSCYVL